ncbi:MAG TPA: DUF6011 domain-containing protein [Thermomonas sp.]|nr:DUF6011 domain-containing protein [Thermomonas sp.]
MIERCESCRRRLISAESREVGFGPVCLERLRGNGLVVHGKRRPSLLQLASTGRKRRRKPDPGQMPLEGMEP